MRRHLLYTLFILCGMLHAQQVPGGFADRNGRYRLQPNDVIEVQYRYTPEYNQTANVQPDGFVTLQLVGDVKVAGLTLDQAHDVVLTAASQRLNKPDLLLLVKDFEKPHFVVTGEVNTPGRFELRGDLKVSEAIAMAGGLKAASAKHSQVLLVRRINESFGETHLIDLKAFERNRDFSEDLTIRPGDMVVVPQNAISKIERFVKWGNVGMYANPVMR